MNVARLLRPRHLFSRSPLSRSPLPLPRHFTAPPSLPINGTMDQKIEFLMIKAIDLNKAIATIHVQLRYLTIGMSATAAGVGAIFASGGGLLIWYIQDSIEERRKSKDA
ncbi:hypothetical protein TWF694_007141 [Orbilia ellipsospora]|uniref:Uncharacterized protein n=1 Tax=Orbilia ellipsospora TaxID=2528407 RepID=A0AAV9WQT8_9PEZI